MPPDKTLERTLSLPAILPCAIGTGAVYFIFYRKFTGWPTWSVGHVGSTYRSRRFIPITHRWTGNDRQASAKFGLLRTAGLNTSETHKKGCSILRMPCRLSTQKDQ